MAATRLRVPSEVAGIRSQGLVVFNGQGLELGTEFGSGSGCRVASGVASAIPLGEKVGSKGFRCRVWS